MQRLPDSLRNFSLVCSHATLQHILHVMETRLDHQRPQSQRSNVMIYQFCMCGERSGLVDEYLRVGNAMSLSLKRRQAVNRDHALHDFLAEPGGR